MRFKPVVDYEKRGLNLSDDAVSFVNAQAMAKHGLYDPKFTNLGKPLLGDSWCSAGAFCWNIELSLNCIISADGSVYLSMSHVGEQEYSIGSIRDRPFSEIWKSHRHSFIVGKMRKEYRTGLCTDCRFMAYNRELTNPSEENSSYLRPEYCRYIYPLG